MPPSNPPPPDVDTYIAGVPAGVQEALEAIRATIRAAVPKVGERIGYGIPSFTLEGRPLLYVAAHARHVGLYPVPTGPGPLAAELAPYVSGRGTMRLPLGAPLPLDLIRRVALLRAEEHRARAAEKGRRR